ncbi:MAG TPA: glycosyltransferase [Bacteroidales bacterium]|jgi:uncharacterized protein (TIGR00661 family)|nr:glycosyltransferase [Bacteroidota bacterium]HJN06746.1 glycosyltransferase [Bacteroidales bacterium]|tara:strand:- start:1142 stop:2224 length:1083 start_codon:yes stop_codon:yes gene_type:complete
MEPRKNILVCPLDWGLGHATRMVPVIEMLERKGANVIIAADNRPLEFLVQRFPQNTTIQLPGYSPNYPSNNNMALAMLTSLPSMILEARQANRRLQTIINEHNIDAVISDNRYELSTSKVPTVFITHQLNIQTSGWHKIGKPIINCTINHYLNKFNEVWVPDIPGKFRLSGNLSKSNKFASKLFNIGLLSRFSKPEVTHKSNSIDILIILSGPEPQRTILEKLLLSQALKTELKTVILLGKPEEQVSNENKNVKLISHITDDEFSLLIQSAKIVISRPGYSTLMDLAVFGKKAIFIPTPGQTEQEYLANRLLDEGIAFSQSQSNFDLPTALKNEKLYKGLFLENKPELLELRIDKLLNIC